MSAAKHHDKLLKLPEQTPQSVGRWTHEGPSLTLPLISVLFKRQLRHSARHSSVTTIKNMSPWRTDWTQAKKKHILRFVHQQEFSSRWKWCDCWFKCVIKYCFPTNNEWSRLHHTYTDGSYPHVGLCFPVNDLSSVWQCGRGKRSTPNSGFKAKSKSYHVTSSPFLRCFLALGLMDCSTGSQTVMWSPG